MAPKTRAAHEVRLHSPLERGLIRTGLDEFYRSVPWLIMVLLGVLAGWNPDQIASVVMVLVPIVLVGRSRPVAV